MSRVAPIPIACQTVCVVGAIVCRSLSVSAQTPPQTPPGDGFPEGTGKAVMLRVCGSCHGPDTVVQSQRTRQEWSDVLDQMGRFGAEATDQEFEQILGYLVKFYSPIQINKAPAKDLQTQLDVDADVADAVVRLRQEKGPFKTIDDLKGVPGLDWTKVESRKARFVFSS